jgi:Uma2 family endonuclease
LQTNKGQFVAVESEKWAMLRTTNHFLLQGADAMKTVEIDPPVEPTAPELEQGDHLTRGEFERRYEAMPHLKKAELIEGVVYIAPPARHSRHSAPNANLIGWLATYEAYTSGVQAGTHASVRLDGDNEFQPDALLLIDPKLGGNARISGDDIIEGSPEWVGEVASSSASIDLHTKLRVYQRNGVQEYVVWRVLDAAVDWFVLRQEKFHRLAAGDDGLYRSEVLPGLWLDAAALVRGDLARVLTVLQEGLASAEHAAFTKRLNGIVCRGA